MQAITNVNDASPFNVPATFNRQAAKLVKAKVARLILVYAVMLTTHFVFFRLKTKSLNFRRTFPVTH
jgi:hypothetical protein